METTFTQKTRKNAELISKKITEHPMITAIVLCLFFFLAAMVFCDPKYESNDDFWTDTVLSGVWTGEYDQHLLLYVDSFYQLLFCVFGNLGSCVIDCHCMADIKSLSS